jgi:transposase
LPLGYEVFAGNTHDSMTVEDVVSKMERLYGKADRIWVMDRGMVSEQDLEKLRQDGRRYIIGTPKANLKQVEKQLLEKSDWQVVHSGVEVKICPSLEAHDEVFILCKSQDRALKEQSTHDRFVVRIEKGIEKLKRTCEERHGKNITNYARWIMTDVEGNEYKTVRIGSQIWMAENLRSTKYRTGSITLDTSTATWGPGTEGKCCYYNNTTNTDSIKKLARYITGMQLVTPRKLPLRVGMFLPTQSGIRCQAILVVRPLPA